MGTRHEELDRAVSQHVVRVEIVFGRDVERRHPVDVLRCRSQRLTARRHDAHDGTGAQQSLGHTGGGINQMLTIVEHHENMPAGDRCRDAFDRDVAGERREAQRGGDGHRDELRIGQRSELGQSHAVGEPRQQLTRYFETQPGLADAPRTGQGHQSVARDEIHHLT